MNTVDLLFGQSAVEKPKIFLFPFLGLSPLSLAIPH